MLKNTQKNHQNRRKITKIVSFHAKISDITFDQKFFEPPEVGFTMAHTDRTTNTQTDIATLLLNRPSEKGLSTGGGIPRQTPGFAQVG